MLRELKSALSRRMDARRNGILSWFYPARGWIGDHVKAGIPARADLAGDAAADGRAHPGPQRQETTANAL